MIIPDLPLDGDLSVFTRGRSVRGRQWEFGSLTPDVKWK